MKDLLSRIGQWTEKMWRSIPIHLRDAIFTALLLGIAAAICFVLRSIDENGSFTLLIFVLAVVIISRFTEGYFWGVFSSLFGVICVNFVFTYPFWAFNFRLTGYPLTFLTMLAVSLIISAMNTKIKKQERLRTEAERETMRANLLRAMSHDIRTPLTSIVGNTSAILENGDTLSTEQQRELLRDVNEDAQWLIRMVENLLSVTRIDADGVAILNGDDALLDTVALPQRIVRCGESAHADVRVSALRDCGIDGIACTVTTERAEYQLNIPAPGRHMIYAASLAAAVGEELGLSVPEIERGVALYEPAGSRMRVHRLSGDRRLLDDCYNANPSSMRASVGNFLAEPLEERQRRVLILGDMLELGDWSEREHAAIIEMAAQDPEAELLLVGPEFAKAYDGLAEKPANVTLCPTRDDLISLLKVSPVEHSLVLVKGSHGMGLEQALEAL